MRSGRFTLASLAPLALFTSLGCSDAEVEFPPAGAEGGSGGQGAVEAAGGSGGVEDTPGEGRSGTGGGGPDIPYPDPEWPEATPADHGLDVDQLEAAALVAEQLDSHCLLVIRGGHLVFERYWKGHDASTPQVSWSIAKSHAATLVGIAVERGDFGSLDDTVASYIPEWQGTPRESITLRDVISMTSGLEWSAFDDYFVLATLSQNHSNHAIGLDQDVDPGSSWTYHNGGVQVLEPVFLAATGMTIEQYAEQHLWSRIGIEATWAHDPSGNPTAYASVLASCRDQARMGYLYMHGGDWAGEQVVPSSFVAEATTPSQLHNRAYGYLWWLNGATPALPPLGDALDGVLSPVTPSDMFSMRGFGNQFVDVIPSLDMIVVRFGTDPMAQFDIPEIIEDARFEKHEQIMEPLLQAVVD